MRFRVLIMGGAPGTSALVAALHRAGWQVTVVIPAGITMLPRHGEVWAGDYQGAPGLVRMMQSRSAEAVINASHPFHPEHAVDITEAARALGLPWISFSPAPWDSPKVQIMPTAPVAAQWIQRNRHFALISANPLWVAPDAFAGDAANLYVFRSPEPRRIREFHLPERHRILSGAYTGDSEEEAMRVLRANQIDVVCLADTGESQADGMISACERLGIDLVAIARPPAPGIVAHTIDEALRLL